ncbi:DVU_1553 family AMP-dependent CoA ligase [Desulfoluna spongiiphila]|uniref:DVU_1553 family AMP-dependent CoA ligase n=1 Tax=Desulfoluna spongiiphila TaxID=419481 RepID=UPI0012551F89|nr:AMP-binding protein [Desulfoluna spongiiphila]VVS91552.1 amp-dependent synthetase/ligase [Desulfoluna spongiiphila]
MTHSIPISPIESWVHKKISAPGARLTREALTRYQMARVQETLDHALERSPFYKKAWRTFTGKKIKAPSDLHDLPFTKPEDIQNAPLGFLTVSQDEIARVVTLNTSGTTAAPKRIFFTEEDLELTVDYFAHAMADFVSAGETVTIFMPGDKPHSIGQLIRDGLNRIGVEGIVAGPVSDPHKACRLIANTGATCLIGIPTQMLHLARTHRKSAAPGQNIRSVILSADYVPRSMAQAIESAWGCRVFDHYGMTEMGYAGGVACCGECGYHFREADLYLEIIDPASGRPVNDGEPGEVVFTTLTRKGMPLIRYRTGDKAGFSPHPCPCGTVLRRLDPVLGRTTGGMSLKNGSVLTLPELDEALFSVPGLLNFTAELSGDSENKGETDILRISLLTVPTATATARHTARQQVAHIDTIIRAMDDGALSLAELSTDCRPRGTTGMVKRTFTDNRSPRQQIWKR